jgi:hypothetical protein
MAFDPTSAFQAVSAIGSLFGAAEADKQRASALREAIRLRQEALAIASQTVEDEWQRYQQRLQAGDFDATKAIEVAQKEAGTNLKNRLGESMTSLRNLGYKEGDSPFNENQRNLSERALLEQEKTLIGLKQQYQGMQEQAYSRYLASKQNKANMLLGQSGQVFAQAPPGGNTFATIQELSNIYGRRKPQGKSSSESFAGVAPMGTTYGTDSYGNPVSVIPDNPNKQYPWEQ